MTDPTPAATVVDDLGDATTVVAEIAEPPAAVTVAADDTAPGPRTRWAGIVWGLVFAGLAIAGVWLTGDADRVDALSEWLQQLDAGTAIAYGLLALGGLVLVLGLTGLLRRAQRALADRP